MRKGVNMKRQPISYDEYKGEIMRIYRDLRREGYYYNLLISLFEECTTCDMKVIPVYLNTGYKENAVRKVHDRSQYADSHSLQDIIIVPERYEYEKTTPPYISIEVKKPDISFKNGKIVKYNLLEVEGKKKEQLQEQFKYCSYIIFTDCVTWYFIKRDNFIKNDFSNNISLIKECNDEWKDDIMWEKMKCKIEETINESKQIKV